VIRIARAAATLVLVVAFGTLPTAIDWCAASCETTHTTGAGNAAPPCHHTSSPAAHLGHMPTPCSHDHHAALVMTAGGQTVATRSPIADIALPATPALTAVPSTIAGVDDAPVHRPQDSIPLALSAALRV
jgi:hypothetical protein